MDVIKNLIATNFLITFWLTTTSSWLLDTKFYNFKNKNLLDLVANKFNSPNFGIFPFSFAVNYHVDCKVVVNLGIGGHLV